MTDQGATNPAMIERFWRKEVEDARELIEHSRGMQYTFVGLHRAHAIIAVDEESKRMRHSGGIETPNVTV